MEREIQLLCREQSRQRKDPIMAYKSAKTTTEIVAVDPIDHVTAVTRAQSHRVRNVDFGHVSLNVIHAVHEVLVRRSTPILADCVGESLAVAR